MEPLSAPADALTRITLRVDVGAVAPPGCRSLAVEIVLPDNGIAADTPVLCCFPGGGMSRRYFDLPAPGYSFAAYCAAAGLVTVLVDHPGVGDSDVPDDGWCLTPEVVADIDAEAVRWVVDRLRGGHIAGVPALRPAAVVGVGHSAGALVLLHQQAAHAPYDAVVPLGWAGHGLPEYLDELPQDAEALVAAAKRRFGAPLVDLPRGSSGLLVAGEVPELAGRALVAARARLLTVVGLASMVPGSATPAATQVAVPVFLGVGEHDIAVSHHTIPAEFPASGDVTLFVLAGAGHNHHVASNRELLWRRIVTWIKYNIVQTMDA